MLRTTDGGAHIARSRAVAIDCWSEKEEEELDESWFKCGFKGAVEFSSSNVEVEDCGWRGPLVAEFEPVRRAPGVGVRFAGR